MNKNDKSILRPLAEKWMELAALPVMDERRRQWKALKDLKAERPMIRVETRNITDYVSDSELLCEDDFSKDLEKQLRWKIRNVEELNDDIVLEPYFCIPWNIRQSDYGVVIKRTTTLDSNGNRTNGFAFNHPIKTPEDIFKLRPRTREINRQKTLERKEKTEEALSGILPVVIHGSQTILPGLTKELHKLIGMENMMLWMYDEPDAIHSIVKYLADDFMEMYEWMEKEKLLFLNNHNEQVGSGSYGYVSDLPGPDYDGKTLCKDLWIWIESQETVSVSPEKFAEFFLPYMSKISKKFGLVYYGCCEPLHDRWNLIQAAIPNIRAISISPWSDLGKMGEMLGKNYVFSRKPMPAYISGDTADWDLLRQDVENTLEAAKGCNIEFIFRDLMTINGDRSRLSKWVEMVRSLI